MKIVNSKYRTIFVILLTMISFHALSQNQKYVIKDSLSQNTIPYVTIIYNQSHFGGCYSDENGIITIPDSVKNIEIAHISYIKKVVDLKKNEGNEILLSPSEVNLNEVIINKRNFTVKNIGFYSQKSSSGFGGSSGWLFALFIPYQQSWSTSPAITAIKCAVEKNFMFKGSYHALMRFDLQKPDPKLGCPDGISLIGTDLIYDKRTFEKKITMQLPNYITFPHEGLFVVIEWINPDTSTSQCSYEAVSLSTTRAINEDFTWVKKKFRGEDWHKWSNDSAMINFKDILKGKIENLCAGISIIE